MVGSVLAGLGVMEGRGQAMEHGGALFVWSRGVGHGISENA